MCEAEEEPAADLGHRPYLCAVFVFMCRCEPDDVLFHVAEIRRVYWAGGVRRLRLLMDMKLR